MAEEIGAQQRTAYVSDNKIPRITSGVDIERNRTFTKSADQSTIRRAKSAVLSSRTQVQSSGRKNTYFCSEHSINSCVVCGIVSLIHLFVRHVLNSPH